MREACNDMNIIIVFKIKPKIPGIGKLVVQPSLLPRRGLTPPCWYHDCYSFHWKHHDLQYFAQHGY